MNRNTRRQARSQDAGYRATRRNPGLLLQVLAHALQVKAHATDAFAVDALRDEAGRSALVADGADRRLRDVLPVHEREISCASAEARLAALQRAASQKGEPRRASMDVAMRAANPDQ